MLEDRTCLKVEYLDVICEVVRLILRRRSPAPESGCSIKIGLNIYICYAYIN